MSGVVLTSDLINKDDAVMTLQKPTLQDHMDVMRRNPHVSRLTGVLMKRDTGVYRNRTEVHRNALHLPLSPLE